jgi:DNA-binding beta-propeller fold protein YncE
MTVTVICTLCGRPWPVGGAEPGGKTAPPTAGAVVVVVAGTPIKGGKPIAGTLRTPFGVEADRAGHLYIAEFAGEQVRRLDPQGRLTTFAGTGTKGFAGDGGPASQAQFDGMHNLAVAPNGDVIIADSENHVVRKLLVRDKRVVRLAGTGRQGSAGVGGPPQKVELNRPHGVFVDPQGTLYIADSDNHRVLKIEVPRR